MHCFGGFIHLLTEGCSEDLIWQAVSLEFEGDEHTLLDNCVAHAVYLWRVSPTAALSGGVPHGERRMTFGTVNKECADIKTLPCGTMLSALLRALTSFAHLGFFNCPTPFLLCVLSSLHSFTEGMFPLGSHAWTDNHPKSCPDWRITYKILMSSYFSSSWIFSLMQNDRSSPTATTW